MGGSIEGAVMAAGGFGSGGVNRQRNPQLRYLEQQSLVISTFRGGEI